MSRLIIRLLGAPQVEVNGVAVEVDRSKALALLAYLAVTERPHARGALALLFWPDNANARTHLRGALFRARQALGEDGERWLASNDDKIALHGDDLWVDVAEFRRQIEQIRRHNHAPGDLCPTCRRAADQAIALHRGDFLADLALRDCPEFDTWQVTQREHLRREASWLLAALTDAHAADHAWDAAIEVANRRLALDSLDEAAHRKLMLLYCWNGQRTLALRQYGECVRSVRNELDAPPEEATERLAAVIREGVAPPPPVSPVASVPVARTSTSNLPAALTVLIGRDAEVQTIVNLLRCDDVRLLTLTGPGGVGKTSLSIQVAADLVPDFADGVYFVSLAPILEPEHVPEAIARAVNMHESQQHTPLAALQHALRNRRLLLLLDNFEHILPATLVVSELLLACPNIKVLATSREVLHLYGETVYPVPRLSVPNAVKSLTVEAISASSAMQLFAQRAQAIHRGFALNSVNAFAVAEICRRLDGLPLAIELAAARMRHFSPQELLHRFDRDGQVAPFLSVLKHDQRNMPTRHRSLWATIAWSYDLLDASEQATFRRLAVFVSGWTVEAAQSVCGAGVSPDIEDALWSLVDKQLIHPAEESGGALRFTMLETLREFGLEQLREAGELPAVQQEMAAYFAAIAEHAKTTSYRANAQATLRHDVRIAEYDNMRAVLTWALAHRNADIAMRLCASLVQLWQYNLRDAEQVITATLALAEGRPPSAVLFDIYVAAGFCARLSGKPEAAHHYMQQAVDVADRIGVEQTAPSELASALHVLAWTMFDRGDYVGASALITRAVQHARSNDNPWYLAMQLVNAGRMALRMVNPTDAAALIDESLRLHRQVGEIWGLLKTLADLAELHVTTGDLNLAAQVLVECEMLLERTHLPDQTARVQQVSVLYWLHSNDAPRAARILRQALNGHETIGSQSGVREDIFLAAEVAALAGLPHQALCLLGAHGAVLRGIGYVYQPLHRQTVEAIVKSARNLLDPADADAAWVRGQAMSEEGMVVYALQEVLEQILQGE